MDIVSSIDCRRESIMYWENNEQQQKATFRTVPNSNNKW